MAGAASTAWGASGMLAGYARSNAVDVIYIGLPMSSQPRILQRLDALRDTTASIHLVPDLAMADRIQARMDDLAGVPAVPV